MKRETGQLIDKANRAIHAAEILLGEGDFDFSASRAYYAMFYTAEALLNENGLHFRKHGGLHAAFGEQFVKTGIFDSKFHRWLLNAFDQRIQGDYGAEVNLTGEEARRLIEQAREFWQATSRYLIGT